MNIFGNPAERAIGCPPLYSCRTLNSRPHKNPPMGSRSAVLNAVLLKLVAKEKGGFHSFMMFQIRFNLLGGCFACRCFCSSASFCNFICSGIHFRAVGLLIPKSRAHFDTLPPGCSAYQASTCFCCVGAPALFMFGLSLDYCRRLSQTAKRTPAGNPWGLFAGVASCVRCQYSVFITTLCLQWVKSSSHSRSHLFAISCALFCSALDRYPEIFSRSLLTCFISAVIASNSLFFSCRV